jgi:penicillin-binding protein 1A
MSRYARQRRTRRNRSGPSKIVFVTLGALAVTLVLGAIGAVAYVLSIASEEPKLGALKPVIAGASSQVFAADGTRLGFIQSDALRTPITTAQMPRDVREATVAIEDQRFYKNDGIDLTGIFRSAVKDVVHGQALQGASTITMQLVRNLYLGSDTHTFKQKIAEAKLALEYNKRHSKQAILTEYLNSVPYGTVGGQTAIGIQAAARIFFDESAHQLNLQQAALLAGLPQAPSQYNPFLYPASARRRRNLVLAKMAELHDISAAQASAAQHAPLEVKHGDYYSKRQESFFFEYVRQKLVKRYGLARVEQGGMKVYTTIDLRMQRLARKAIAQVLDQPEDPASAIVTIDPRNGYIKAMAESESYDQSQYNLASQGHRQPGSTFKAIVLADALSKGIDPNSTTYVSHTLAPGWLPGYPTYEVKTFENTSSNKSLNLVQATLASDNTVYAQLAADLGERSVTHMAYKLGVRVHLHSYPAEALGGLTVGVSPLEMANVYATFADGGWRNTPIAITKVVFPDGHADTSWGKRHRVRAISEAVAAEETSILHQNVLGGTAVRSAIACPTAAKTGTTSNLVDAWLDGYNSDYSTSVWMGYPKSLVPMTDVHGEPQQGGYLPAEIWHAYMAAVTEGRSCPELFKSKESLSYAPFYGNYSGRSAPSESYESESESRVGTPSPAPEHRSPSHPQHVEVETHESPTPEAHGPAARAHEPPPPAPSEPAAHVGPSGGAEPPTH